MKLARILLAFAAFFLSVSPSVADVSYVYVGNDYTWVRNNYWGETQFSTSDYVRATLTFSSPLAANMVGQSVTPKAWLLDDGTGFYFYGGTFTLSLTTNSSGNIVGWYIFATDGTQGSGHAIWSTTSYDMSAQMNEGGNSNDPGTWTSNASPVPEPCSIALALTGVGALVARRRKKLLKSAE